MRVKADYVRAHAEASIGCLGDKKAIERTEPLSNHSHKERADFHPWEVDYD